MTGVQSLIEKLTNAADRAEMWNDDTPVIWVKDMEQIVREHTTPDRSLLTKAREAAIAKYIALTGPSNTPSLDDALDAYEAVMRDHSGDANKMVPMPEPEMIGPPVNILPSGLYRWNAESMKFTPEDDSADPYRVTVQQSEPFTRHHENGQSAESPVHLQLGKITRLLERICNETDTGDIHAMAMQALELIPESASSEIRVMEGVRSEQKSSPAEVARNGDNVAPSATEQPVLETAGQFLQSLGMDGKLWAEEMHKRFPAISEDDLLGWCCNMIMAGFDEAERRARKRESRPPAESVTNCHLLTKDEQATAVAVMLRASAKTMFWADGMKLALVALLEWLDARRKSPEEKL